MADLDDFDDFDTGKGGYGDEDGNLLISGVDTRTQYVELPSGHRVQVTIAGEEGRPGILAFGDIGLNISLSFGHFLGYPPVKELLFPYFTFYGVDFPYQEAGAPGLEHGDAYPSFEELVGSVGVVMEAFGLERVVVMGLGAGGTVVTHYAVANPGKIAGAVIIGSTHKAPGWLEWTYSIVSTSWLSWVGVDAYAKDALIQRYFSLRDAEAGGVAAGGAGELLRSTYAQALDAVNPVNLWKFISSFMARPHLEEDTVGAISSRFLFFVGQDSYYHQDVLDFFGLFNPALASIVTVWGAGNMVHMEAPHQFVTPLRLFFYAVGHRSFGASGGTKADWDRFKAASRSAQPGSGVGVGPLIAKDKDIDDSEDDLR